VHFHSDSDFNGLLSINQNIWISASFLFYDFLQILIFEGKNKALALQLEEKTKDYADMKTLLESMKEQLKISEDVQAKIIEWVHSFF